MEPANPNLRDVRKVLMVTCLEGKGTNESPYKEVRYIIDLDGRIWGELKD